MNKNTKSKYKIKQRLVCRSCWQTLFNLKEDRTVVCPGCGKKIDARDRSGYYAEYKKKYPEMAQKRFVDMERWRAKNKNSYESKQRSQLKNRVFKLISNNNPKCANCGCDDIRFLEINHINGNGGKELRATGQTKFLYDIALGRRNTSDLNLLCRVCNALYYLKTKYGDIPMRVKWNSKK
jgi:DNA-directed RNA polymerase subunit RPC12/RpoP